MIATLNRSRRINGVNVPVLLDLIEGVKRDPANGQTSWAVTTRWDGGAASVTQISGFEIGGKRVERDFTLRVDEPLQLAGTNTAPNPQEYLLASLNACMVVGCVAQASLHGIKLDSLEIDCKGDIDLRGFMGLSKEVRPGYETIRYTVRIKGDGTPEQFEEIHRAVMTTSPNRFNLANPVRLEGELVVE
jgi:uncharacterized OsmC-like protein